ncbi:PEPxxWA-CTERM sorting domain-containing protein [Sphingobium sp. CR28]|uniref:PEPxxWA-CTERM sorting domain-containing protein n=1 Tax=Sphingobium sp. CR28 TaxID=3400272 RepID=UPI003FEED938
MVGYMHSKGDVQMRFSRKLICFGAAIAAIVNSQANAADMLQFRIKGTVEAFGTINDSFGNPSDGTVNIDIDLVTPDVNAVNDRLEKSGDFYEYFYQPAGYATYYANFFYDSFSDKFVPGLLNYSYSTPGTCSAAPGICNVSGGTGSFTVTPILSGALPEPTTWALMLIGFGAVGISLRRAERWSNPRLTTT